MVVERVFTVAVKLMPDVPVDGLETHAEVVATGIPAVGETVLELWSHLYVPMRFLHIAPA